MIENDDFGWSLHLTRSQILILSDLSLLPGIGDYAKDGLTETIFLSLCAWFKANMAWVHKGLW